MCYLHNAESTINGSLPSRLSSLTTTRCRLALSDLQQAHSFLTTISQLFPASDPHAILLQPLYMSVLFPHVTPTLVRQEPGTVVHSPWRNACESGVNAPTLNSLRTSFHHGSVHLTCSVNSITCLVSCHIKPKPCVTFAFILFRRILIRSSSGRDVKQEPLPGGGNWRKSPTYKKLGVD